MLDIENLPTISFYGENIIGYTNVVIINDETQLEQIMEDYNDYLDDRFLFRDKINNIWIGIETTLGINVYESLSLEEILKQLIRDETLIISKEENERLLEIMNRKDSNYINFFYSNE